MISHNATQAPRAFGHHGTAAATANLELARQYLAAIEAGTTGDALAGFFHDDVEQIEYPNRFVPPGATRNLAEILAAAERGRNVLSSQRYEVHFAHSASPFVILEVLWVGVVAVPVGTLAAGAEMRAQFAVVLEIQSGRIIRQRNYDCFYPF